MSFLSLAFIYNRIVERENFETFIAFIHQKITATNAGYYLIIVALLMFVNYGIEAMKWKLLISHLSELKLLKSIQAIFLGTTISFFTPNRVGEFAGRILFLQSRVRIQAVLSTFVGSISQLLVTIVLGIISLALFARYYMDVSSSQQTLLFVLSLLISFILLWFFPRIKNIFSLQLFSKLRTKYPDYINVFESYTKRELWNILGLSLLRYVIFSWQYILLLQVCGVDLPLWIFAITISIIFFLQAIIPSIAFTELAFRGSLAVLVMHKFTYEENGIIAASFGLWLVNLALPAAIGSFMFLYFKLKNKNIEA